MSIRTTLTRTARKVQMTLSRATIRDFDDKHLIQRIKAADVYHSETPTDFERWQMVGLSSTPLKQEQEATQSQSQNVPTSKGGQKADWNHNQPKGRSAEAIMLYLGGSRSLPIAMVDDPRVRPYALKEGETSLYAASGTGQMLFHNNAGSYLVAVNNPPEQSTDNKDTERFASLRHVVKSKQPREIKKGQDVPEHKHEGETVNLEVRTTSSRIEFRAGDTVVGYYDKAAATWVFIGKVKLGSEDANRLVHRKGDMDTEGDVAVQSAELVYAK